MRSQIGEAVADELQVALEGRVEGIPDMDGPALAEDGDHRGLGRQQGLQVLVGIVAVLL